MTNSEVEIDEVFCGTPVLVKFAGVVVVPGTSITTILVVSTDPSELVNVVSLVVVIVSGMSGSSVIVDNTSELVVSDVLTVANILLNDVLVGVLVCLVVVETSTITTVVLLSLIHI